MAALRAWGLVALALATAAAGGAARGAVAPNVPGNLQAAIALEKQALRDLGNGKLDAVEKGLKRSRSLLQGALAGVPASDYASARSDIKQADAQDDVALDNLRRPAQRSFVRLKINIAIIRKEGALAAFGYERQIATAPPAPPKQSQPPRITSFEATLAPPDTTYRVTAVDPDTLPERLTYVWTNSNTCGRFSNVGPNARWEHGDNTNCSHGSTFHAGEITVTVADGAGSSCTVRYTNGSLGVAPYDPGEDCQTPPPEPVLVVDVRSVNEFADGVDFALSVERKLDAAPLMRAARLLKAIQVDMANALSASKGGRYFQQVMKIMRFLHSAEELDREAAADLAAKQTDSAKRKVEAARDKKNDALDELDRILDDLED